MGLKEHLQEPTAPRLRGLTSADKGRLQHSDAQHSHAQDGAGHRGDPQEAATLVVLAAGRPQRTPSYASGPPGLPWASAPAAVATGKPVGTHGRGSPEPSVALSAEVLGGGPIRRLSHRILMNGESLINVVNKGPCPVSRPGCSARDGKWANAHFWQVVVDAMQTRAVIRRGEGVTFEQE